VLNLLVGFFLGIFSGILTNIVWERRHWLRYQLTTRRQRSSGPLGFDPTTVGLFVINRWSAGRPLHRNLLKTTVSESRPHAQKWFDEQRYAEILAAIALDHDGATCYLTDFRIDHRESRAGEFFCVTLTPARYSEHLATSRYLRENPETYARISAALASGDLREFAHGAPPASVKINVAILSLSNKFLAIQRSSAVDEKKNLWTVGPNEVMRPPGAQPGYKEDFFLLAERGLREELGLEPYDYGPISISWIGYYLPNVSVKVYAQVLTRLTEHDLMEKFGAAESIFEARELAWISFDHTHVMDVVRNWNRGDAEGRMWSDSAPLALQELWRMRSCLRLD
jgi:hypothetical protein